MPLKSLQDYFDFQRSPWGEMQYRLQWEQLAFAQGLRILDFGSGTGKTADHLAALGDVTAVEPSADMLAQRHCENGYRQIHGGIDDLPDEPFDLVTCHNVLEFVEDRERYLEELAKRVKPGGRLSIVKHNLPGRAMRQAVLQNDPAGALALLRGEMPSNPFGAIHVYDTGELVAWAANHGFALEKHCGIRAFYSLREDDDGWDDPAWGEAAHGLEQAAAELEPYRSIAFYHHVILRKL
ncbi:MAG: methyltransferase domain-containing protein [Firmicutes bacterium]|nr:methyltransferase domain-containing protein [Bacillota bacterium]